MNTGKKMYNFSELLHGIQLYAVVIIIGTVFKMAVIIPVIRFIICIFFIQE